MSEYEVIALSQATMARQQEAIDRLCRALEDAIEHHRGHYMVEDFDVVSPSNSPSSDHDGA